MNAAILQMTSGIDPLANARTLTDGVAQAAADGALMLFTPEMSGLLDRQRERAAANIVAEGEDRVLAAVREAAAKYGVWVHLGSLALRGENDARFVNRGFVIDGAGKSARATTSCICSTSICRPASAGANPMPMRPVPARWWPRRRWGCWASRSAMICAFPTCSAR